MIGRVGRLRVLPRPHPLLLGSSPALVCTPGGLPVGFALTHPKADEREVLVNLFDVEPQLLADRPGQLIIAFKGYRNAETGAILGARGATLLRPAFKSEPRRPGEYLLKTVRRFIDSINQTLKAQLGLERHGDEPPKD